MEKGKKTSKTIKVLIVGAFAGLANGLFGSGGGTVVVPAMVYLMDIEDHKAHSTAIAIILPLSLISAFFYIKGNYVDIQLTWKVVLGGLLGGFIGAKLLNKCPTKILRLIFGIFMIVAAIRMII